MPRYLIAATASRLPGRSSTPSSMSGARPRPPPCRNILPVAGARGNPIYCSSATIESGTTRSHNIRIIKSIQAVQGELVILAGDVGGTKCNLALFSEKGGTLTPVFKQRFASKEFARFDLIVKEFARQAADHLGSERIVAAGFGIAGPVINGRVRATNLPWTVDTATLIKELDVPNVVLLNDLGATGHSLEHLPPEDFCVLNPGKPEPGGREPCSRRAPDWGSRSSCGTAGAIASCPPKAGILTLLRTRSSRSSCSGSCAAAILR